MYKKRDPHIKYGYLFMALLVSFEDLLVNSKHLLVSFWVLLVNFNVLLVNSSFYKYISSCLTITLHYDDSKVGQRQRKRFSYQPVLDSISHSCQ